MSSNYSRELSVVITVLNEEENIAPLVHQLEAALRDIDYEVLFVDDGSTDATRERILERTSARIILVELRRNYGQSTAISAGVDHARGRYIALLDGDLQNDPADIPRMLRKLKDEDWDVVAGNRRNRQDGMLFRKIPSLMANALIRHQTGVHIKDYGCTLKLFKAGIAGNLGLYGELHRFIPVLACLQGARITQMDVEHHPRRYGHSKYGIDRTMKVASDLLLILFFQRYMQKPMHLFGGMGLLLMVPGGAGLIYLLALKIMGQDIGGKPLLTLSTLLLILGFILITLGIIAELLVRIYYESQDKKRYHVRQVSNQQDEN